MKRILFVLLAVVLLATSAGAGKVTAAPETLAGGNGYIDTWVFIDNDRNGIYSAGDVGLTDVVVCLNDTKSPWKSCVGTDQGDTWWEDLPAARYAATLQKETLPAGYKLSSIKCYTTAGKKFSCDTYKSTMRAYARLKDTTRINIFFALKPTR